MLLTIFTPTYNRAHLLPQLYNSLLAQELFDFEWVIVDDGSTDNTEELVNSFILDNKISIVYFKQKNSGKHIAINKGVSLAKGELFFIVDSDDYLTPDALTLIVYNYEKIKSDSAIAGISFRRGYSETEYVGSNISFENCIKTVFEFRYDMRIEGDMAELFKTKIMKQFPFPQIEGERFCPEILVWHRIGLKYKLLWTSKIVYISGYEAGGLTDRIFEIRKKSPNASMMTYAEWSKGPVSFYQKIRAAVNYWRFAKFSNLSFSEKWKNIAPLLSVLAIPLSWIFLLKEK